MQVQQPMPQDPGLVWLGWALQARQAQLHKVLTKPPSSRQLSLGKHSARSDKNASEHRAVAHAPQTHTDDSRSGTACHLQVWLSTQ